MKEQVEDSAHETSLEYHGSAGATMHCAEAVERLLHSGPTLEMALVLTHRRPEKGSHALLITNIYGDQIVVKAGFTSGYGGAGPKGFSATLALLEWHGVPLDEVIVEEQLLDRLDAAALTIGDLEAIATAPRVKPPALWDYILDSDYPSERENPWRRREPAVPLAVIDDRLAPAARDFWDDPDGKLMKAHRQLEVAVREKAQITIEEAAKGPAATYRLAFNGDKPRLMWATYHNQSTSAEQICSWGCCRLTGM